MNNIKDKIRSYIYESLNTYKKLYDVSPKIKFRVKSIPTEDVPANCANLGNHDYLLTFDIDKINNKWIDVLKYMVYHEVAHIVESELNFEHPDSTGAGHNRVFIDILRSVKDEFTPKEWGIFITRHVSQYLNDIK